MDDSIRESGTLKLYSGRNFRRTMLLAVVWSCLAGTALRRTDANRHSQVEKYALVQARTHFNTEKILHSRMPEAGKWVGSNTALVRRSGLEQTIETAANDAWEVQALAALKSGAAEYFTIQNVDGSEHLHWMGPVYTERSCSSCHATADTPIGTIRGGVSVLLPMNQLLAISEGNWRRQLATHIAVWFAGLLGLAVVYWNTARGAANQVRTTEDLAATLQATRAIVENVPFGMVIVGRDRVIRQVNPAAEAILGKTKENLVGTVCHLNICPAHEEACPVMDLGQTVDNSHRMVLGAAGEEIPVDKSVFPIFWKGEDVLIEAFVDMSEQRQVLAEVRGLLEEEQRLNRLAIGRELRMIQLKQEVNSLLENLGRDARYRMLETEPATGPAAEVKS